MVNTSASLNTFNKRLEQLNNSLDIIKKYGLDEEILEAYFVYKLKVSGKMAREIINTIEEFQRKTINKMMIKSLENSNGK